MRRSVLREGPPESSGRPWTTGATAGAARILGCPVVPYFGFLTLFATYLSVFFRINPSLHGGWRSVHNGQPASYRIIFDKFSPKREFLRGGAEHITIGDPSRKNEVPFAFNQVFNNFLRGRIKNSKLQFPEFIGAASINHLVFKGVASELPGRIFIPRITNGVFPKERGTLAVVLQLKSDLRVLVERC